MKTRISPSRLSILAGTAAILGVLMIGLSFAINPGPDSGATPEQITAFAAQHVAPVMWGAWLQAVGPLLIILFALATVHLAGAAQRFSGWMTMFGAVILMTVSLTEVVFYISALLPAPDGMAPISSSMAHAVQHLYFIVAAPALFLPLGIVVLSSSVLPRVFGYLAIVLAVAFAILGVASLQSLVLSAAVTSLAAVQSLWWLAAGITMLARSRRMAEGAEERTAPAPK
jgi:hypothetical protein